MSLKIHQLTFNPFAENTYLLEQDGEVIVIDPGMYGEQEEKRMKTYLDVNGLKPVGLWLTHAHLDHVFGLNWVVKEYGLEVLLHPSDAPIYEHAVPTAMQYGLSMEPLPKAKYELDVNVLHFGTSEIKVFHTPGHSPGSVTFYSVTDKIAVVGDALFQGSIGRTDLPGGDYQTLIDAIKSQLLVLPDDTLVYSGHGPMTTIGQERVSNPFLV